MQSVATLALPGMLMTGVVGPLEIFAIANSLVQGRSEGAGFSPLRITGLSCQGESSFNGMTLPIHAPLEEVEADIIMVPPLFDGVDDVCADNRLVDWLRRRHKAGAIIATSCAGSFLLAETGVLNGRTATTHWHLVDDFRRRYPTVDLQPNMMLIDGGTYICAGGAMAWQDLALHIVSRFLGGEVASTCAKMLVMDSTRHVQTPYFMFEQGGETGDEHADPSVHEVQKWMQQNYQEEMSVAGLANRVGMGVRTFLRRFKRFTGQTPNRYLQQLRIEAARHLLEVSTRNIEEITGMVGYTDSSAFRRLFKERTGVTPKEYRNRFQRAV